MLVDARTTPSLETTERPADAHAGVRFCYTRYASLCGLLEIDSSCFPAFYRCTPTKWDTKQKEEKDGREREERKKSIIRVSAYALAARARVNERNESSLTFLGRRFFSLARPRDFRPRD